MHIQSNAYYFKDTTENVFSKIYQQEQPFSHATFNENSHIFSSKNEIFIIKNEKPKKIANLAADATTLSSHESLLCVGTADGEVQVFSEHRTAIRRFKDHNAEITDILITPKRILISASRDCTIKFYDLVEGSLIRSIEIDGDYASKLLFKEETLYLFTKNIIALSLEDFTQNILYSYSLPIDNACFLDSTILAFTSKNKIYIFDLKMKKILRHQIIHTKDITHIEAFEERLYTCSLDKHFKSFTFELKLINDFYLSSKLISFVISGQQGSPLLIGEDGVIFGIEHEKVNAAQKSYVDRHPAYEDNVDFEVVQQPKKRLTEVDSMLRRFEYKGALLLCIKDGDIKQKFAVLHHISEKRAMMRALKDGDINFLKEVLNLAIETLKITEFTPIITELLLILTTICSDMLVEDAEARDLLEIISNSINEQVAFEETYLKICSFIESFSA